MTVDKLDNPKLKSAPLTPSFGFFCLAFLVLNFLYKLYQLEPLESGGDAVYNWLNCKYLSIGEVGWDSWNHHRTRWGIVLPNLLVIFSFGKGMWSYYIVGILYSNVSVGFLMQILRQSGFGLFSISVAALFYIFFQPLSSSASQMMPSIYSSTYLILSIYFLLRYDRNPSVFNLVFCGLFIFLVYQSKFTGVLFFPGICLAVFASSKNLKHFIVFSVVLFFGIIIDNFSYYFTLGVEMGRLGVISSTHYGTLEDNTVIDSLSDFFRRYTILKEEWNVLKNLYIFGSVVVLFLFSKLSRPFVLISLVQISFYFGLLCSFVDFDPLTVGVLYLDRYLIAGVPLIFLQLAMLAGLRNHDVKPTNLNVRDYVFSLRNLNNYRVYLGDAYLAFLNKIELCFVNGKRFYQMCLIAANLVVFALLLHSVATKQHPAWLNVKNKSSFDHAFDNGIPITTDGYAKTGLLIRGFYWDDWADYKRGPMMEITERKVYIGNRKVTSFLNPQKIQSKEWKDKYLSPNNGAEFTLLVSVHNKHYFKMR